MADTLLIGKDRLKDLTRYLGVDEAKGPDKTVLGMRDIFGGIKMMPIPDQDLTRTVDPVKPSRHRSKRILKKLRKRLGEPFKEDIMLMYTEAIYKAFHVKMEVDPVGTSAYMGAYEVSGAFSMKKIDDLIMRHGVVLGL